MHHKFCLTLDLKDDPNLIKEYEDRHSAVWPEVLQSIKDSGIKDMEIYRHSNRLVMIIEADESFSFEKKKLLDENNAKVQEWEELMWKYQKPLPNSREGEKWMIMNQIFKLREI